MRIFSFLTLASCFCNTSAIITWKLVKEPNPTDDQLDAYKYITTAMDQALDRHNCLAPHLSKHLKVYYVPDGWSGYGRLDGTISFSRDRVHITQYVALHEIAHTLGLGTSQAWFKNCDRNDWPTANRLLQKWDGPDAKIDCVDLSTGWHIKEYGLNYDNEWSELNADRHCLLVAAMMADGMCGRDCQQGGMAGSAFGGYPLCY